MFFTFLPVRNRIMRLQFSVLADQTKIKIKGRFQLVPYFGLLVQPVVGGEREQFGGVLETK